jgi:NIPSNAP
MRTFRGALTVLGLAALGLAAYVSEAQTGGKKVEKRVFELRTYYVHPGKMEALHARFRDHTCKLLEKHGMTLVGFWVPADAKEAQQKMAYLVAHTSREAAEASWKAFRADPDWVTAKKASEKDGPLVERVVSEFLNPTDYSRLK